MYTPHVGRWLSEDPAGYVDGPNQYLYVRNNPANNVDPSGLYAYGNFCGLFQHANCPPGTGPKKPIDAVDGACERHDCCSGPWHAIFYWGCCSARLCSELHDAYDFGCAQSYPGNKDKIEACKKAAMEIGWVFCWPWTGGVPGFGPGEGYII